ncbi:MAG: hypothetical protein ACRD72_19115, partial [Candidatus Angelobacter sp.]
KEKWFAKLSRKALLEFDQTRAKNRATAQEDITKATYDLLEFDRLSVQGTNDALSMTFRYETMRKFLQKLALR